MKAGVVFGCICGGERGVVGAGGDGIFWWVPPPPPLGQRKSERRPFLRQPPGHIPRAGPS